MELAHLIKIPLVENVKISRSNGSNKPTLNEGRLCLSSHHLIYSPKTNQSDEFMVILIIIKRIIYLLSN